MYLRKGFRALQQTTMTDAVDSFRTEYGKNKAIIDIGSNLGMGSSDIYVFVKNNNVKLPKTWKGRDVVKYNVSEALKQSGDILKRLEEEDVDITDPENLYFYKLMVAGKNICTKLT